MDTVEEIDCERAASRSRRACGIQPCGYLLELSLDWIVLRASENIHQLARRIARHADRRAARPLRPLRRRCTTFATSSRASAARRASAGPTRVRLTDDPDLVDIAFQLSDGRVLLEAVPSAGRVRRMLRDRRRADRRPCRTASGQALLDGGARRMRALTGYDRVTLDLRRRVGPKAAAAPSPAPARRVGRSAGDHRRHRGAASRHLSRAMPMTRPSATRCCARLRRQVARAARCRGRPRQRCAFPSASTTCSGEFRCDSRTPRAPSFELHAAAELFAQLFAMRLEIDRLKNG